MNGTPQLLRRLRSLGVRFNLAGDAVEVDAPTTALKESDVLLMKKSRDQIRLLLKIEEATRHRPRIIPDQVSCLDMKHWLDWDSFQFSRFCHRILGRPGPSNVREDQTVLAALLDFVTEEGHR